ncbi:MAG: Cna B-type domain-containing protein, partial [Lachnospiraceae bacterium]|nr:Cna B-type domain-containing protein [Lachnospiraceae bacterium]
MKSWVKKVVKVLAAFFAVIMFVGAFMALSNDGAVTALAEDDPDYYVVDVTKATEDRGDGTTRISLSVTGSAETTPETASNVNVLIVYDTSSSMTSNAQGSSYSRADLAEDVVHDFLDNLAYYQNDAGTNINVALVTFARYTNQHNQGQGWTTDLAGLESRFNDGVGGSNPRYNFSYSGNQSNGTNWDAALNLANELVGSAPGDGATPTFVIMMTDGACTASEDGSNAIAPTNAQIGQLRTFYNAATNDAQNVAAACQATGGTFYGIYAYGTEADLLDDLMYYSVNGQHRGNNINNVVAATQDAPNFFRADNTTALNNAIAQIFQQIIEALGVTQVQISDGTTTNVTTTSDVTMDLLDLVPNYQYWLEIPVFPVSGSNNYTFTRIAVPSGDEVVYTVAADGSTVSWSGGNVTVNGEIIAASGGGYYLKYEWTEANALYDKAPPAAHLNDAETAVVWDLSTIGTLLNGVNYIVTFDVYPSQTAYDLIADLENGAIQYSEIEAQGLDEYIKDNGDGTYSLYTNTVENSEVTWIDTREEPDEDGNYTEHTNTISRVDPVPTDADRMDISKLWENGISDDNRNAEPISLKVAYLDEDSNIAYLEFGYSYVDDEGATQHGVTNEIDLNEGNSYSTSAFVATGLMRTHTASGATTVEILDAGRDYWLVEVGNNSYYWDLMAETVHPMVIDGELTTLVKVEYSEEADSEYQTALAALGTNDVATTGSGDSAKTYYNLHTTEDGHAVIYRALPASSGEGAAAAASISATNYRRSYIDLTKVVDAGDFDVPEGTVFPFNVTITDAVGDDVWFSVRDGSANVYDNTIVKTSTLVITGARAEGRKLTSGTATQDEDGTWWIEYTYNGTEYRMPTGPNGMITDPDTGEAYLGYYTGYYYAPSGTAIGLSIEQGWNVRFINLLSDTTYSIEELNTASDESPVGFVYSGATMAVDYLGVSTDATYDEDFAARAADGGLNITVGEDNSVLSGTIEHGNTSYVATYTNSMTSGTLTATKVWDDLNATVSHPAVTLNLEQSTDNGSTWSTVSNSTKTIPANATGDALTVTWDNLAVVDGQGNEIQYRLAETEVAGYSTEITKDTETANHYIVTNTLEASSLTIEKHVELPEGDYTGVSGETFEFTVTLKNAQGTALTDSFSYVIYDEDDEQVDTGTVSSGGKIELEDGQYAVIANIPLDTEYSVAETAISYYTTTSTGASGTIDADGAEAVFTNTYNPSPATVSFPVKKVLSVPEGLDGPEEWEYTISVAAGTGAPTVTTMSGTVDQDNDTITFGDFTFNAPGTYTYTVTESGTVAGVTNDSAAESGKTVTVTVTDNGDGTLVATASSTENSPLTFTNTYNATPATVSFPVQKVLSVPEGLNGPDEWEYTISVAAGTGAPTVTTMSGTVDEENDTITFGEFSFDTPGTYTYTVTESGTVAGVTNDSAAESGKTVTVTVTDNGDGTLVATASSTTASPLTFTNSYNVEPTTASFPVHKNLVVPPGLTGPEEWSYTISVAAINGAPSAASMSRTINQDTTNGTITFGDFTFDAPGHYTYRVTESGTVTGVTNDTAASTGKMVTVDVEDNGQGELVATVSSTANDPLTFTNTYGVEPVSVDPPVQKIITGRDQLYDQGNFTFAISGTGTAVDGTTTIDAPMPENERITDSPQYRLPSTSGRTGYWYEFGEITFTAPGTYVYTVTESGNVAGVTNDSAASAGKTITFTVTDNGQGELAVSPTTDQAGWTFTNVYNATGSAIIQVTKELTGRAWQDGETFTFTLTDSTGAAVGEPQTVTANARTASWTIDYTLADVSAAPYTYTITETSTLPAGISNPNTVTANVALTDNGNGTIGTVVTYTPTSATITNPYVPTPTDIEITVNKEVPTQPAGLPDATFNFQLYTIDAEGDETIIDTQSITTGASNGYKGSVTFNEDHDLAALHITQANTYTYYVREVIPAEADRVPGYTYDERVYKVDVTVQDDPTTGRLFIPENGYAYSIVDSTETATSVDIVNEYKEESVKATLHVTKIVEDLSLSAPENATFTFTLTAVDGAPMPETEGPVTVEVTTARNEEGQITGAADFPEITYTAAGTYNYTIQETVTDRVDGFTYDETTHNVRVIVDDNFETAVLVVDEENSTLAATITNQYQAKATETTIEVNKTINDTTGTAHETTFTFTLTAVDGAPMPENAEGAVTSSVTGEGTASFDAITYTQAGTFNYTITEQLGDAAGYIYDTKTYSVTVNVTDNGGQLEAAVAYSEQGSTETSTSLTVENTYDPEDATAALRAHKVIDDRTGQAPTATFTFEVIDADENVVRSASISGGGYVDFEAITYSQPGTYEYTIREVAGNAAGYTYDTTTYPVMVTVNDNQGILSAEVSYGDAEEALFTNPYEAEPVTVTLTATKTLTGREMTAGEFSFILTDANGETCSTGTNDASGA